MSVLIDRGFVRLSEGLVHYRKLEGDASLRPLYLIHASPGCSRGLEPLMGLLREGGLAAPLIAPDTLGNGDSAPPGEAAPEIDYFAGSAVRVLDALGLDQVDLFGSHTGARIACELVAAHPERVGKVVLDGIGEYAQALKAAILEHYAPSIAPDEYGRQFTWAFNFVRDQSLHFPYFMRDSEHRLLRRPVPSPEALHAAAIDVLKALGTYHLPYLAAFRYPARARLPAVTRPVLLLKADTDLPSLHAFADKVAPLMPDARTAETLGGDHGKAEAIAAFLRRP